MLRITKVHENGISVTLKLEGKIAEQWATLLDGECRMFLRHRKAVQLECSRVDFVDDSGVEVLKNLPRKHVTITKAPAYMKELLRTGGRS